MKPFTAVFALLASLTIASWLAWPGRNQHGNPDMEEFLGECKTDEHVTARLYQGNGGATISLWYSVTLEGDALGKERQVFFSYATPQIDRVECRDDAVSIAGGSFSRKLEVTEFQKLREKPVQYWSGKQEKRGVPPSRVLTLLAAGLIVTAGVAVALLAPVLNRRRSRNAA